MDVICCDTSFLFSLYGNDAHTSRALNVVSKLGQPITLTALNEYELLNAVRFAVFRNVLSAAAGNCIIATFESDIATGHLVMDKTNLSLVVEEAKKLSAEFTQSAGHRSFDILHVAAASHLSAKLFLSFDTNQRALARTAGIKHLP